MNRLRILVLLAAMAAMVTSAGAATPHHAPLTGSWSGYISGSYGSHRQHMTITINARETAGTWKISARCYGTLTLDSISDGYHHFLRHVAKATAGCGGGDVDCLKPAGADIYDAVTAHQGGAWDISGTLKPARS